MGKRVAIVLVLAIVVGLVTYRVAVDSSPTGDESLTAESSACFGRNMDRMLERLEGNGAFVTADEDCLTEGNWAQEHATIAGLVAGGVTFLVGSIVVALLAIGRITPSSSAPPPRPPS